MLVAVHEILHYFILLSVSFLRCTVGYARRMSEQGSGGTNTQLGITTMVHNPVAQSKHVIN
jgi:hypothetical protein